MLLLSAAPLCHGIGEFQSCRNQVTKVKNSTPPHQHIEAAFTFVRDQQNTSAAWTSEHNLQQSFLQPGANILAVLRERGTTGERNNLWESSFKSACGIDRKQHEVKKNKALCRVFLFRLGRSSGLKLRTVVLTPRTSEKFARKEQ